MSRISGFDGKLNALAKKVRTSKDVTLDVSLFKGNCPREEILKYAHRLPEVVGNPVQVFGRQQISNIQDVTRQVTRWLLKPEKALLWAGAEMRLYSKLIAEFVDLERRFEWEVISGQYAQAKQSLESCRSRFGYSLWYFENLIGLLEISEGLEAQKAFVNALMADKAVPDGLKYFLFYISVRAEKAVSPDRYESQLRRDSSALFDEDDLGGQYASFKLNFFGHVRFKNPGSVIAKDDGLSLIDRYMTLVRLLQICIADRDLVQYRSAAIHSLAYLDKLEGDARVINLFAHLGAANTPAKIPLETARFLDWTDLYTVGQYAEVIKQILDSSQQTPLWFDAIELAARAKARLPSTENVQLPAKAGPEYFLERMRNVFVKTMQTAEAAQDLLKFAFMFPSFRSSAQLFAFLMREYRHASYAVPERFELIGALNGGVMNPRLTLSASSPTAVKNILAVLEQPKKSITCDYFRAWHAADEIALTNLNHYGVPTARIDKALAEICIRANRAAAAEPYYRSMQTTGQFLDYQDALEGLVRIYLRGGEPVKAAEEIVSAVLDRPDLRGRLPIEDTVHAIQRLDSPQVYGETGIPILFDLHVRGGSSAEREEARMFAYQEFLVARGVQKPSELRAHIPTLSRHHIIYFLRYVCIPHVMDSSIAFAGTEELTEERIRICQLLVEIDPSNAAVYADEIKSLTQHLVISKGMHEIERSKIYVDVEGVRSSVEPECRQLFERLMALTSLRQLDERTEQLILDLQRLFAGKGQRVLFSVPVNQRYDAFKQFFTTVRNAFVSSNEYGLDVYLSVGIRHGTLAGQLRSAVEREGLITVKGADGKYKPNDIWDEKLRELDWPNEAIEQMQQAFAEFSAKLDALVENIKNVEVQIKTEERAPSGLLDFSLREQDLRELLRKITRKTTYDEVMSLVIEKLWVMTDQALTNVRQRLSSHKATVGILLDELQRACNKASPWTGNSELNDAIAKVRTSIQEELDRIAFWFTRTSGPEAGEYALTEAIDIALQMIRYIYPKRSLYPRVTVTGKRRLVGRSLSAFVGILFILLDNVVTKSGVEGRSPDCEISMDCGEKTILKVQSELGPDVDIKALRKKMDEIAAEIRGVQSSEIVRKEGGSGLRKVAKILRIDCGCDFTFTPKVEKSKFTVAIELTAGRLLV